MSVDTGKCLRNMTICRPREHILFRDFGLNDVDSPYGLSVGVVKAQCSQFYPDVDSIEIKRRASEDDFALGRYRYTISAKGVEGR